MQYKNIMIFAIFLVSLLAVGMVSAADSNVGDIVGMDNSADAIGDESGSTLSAADDNMNLEVGEEDTPQTQANDEERISETDNGTFEALDNKIKGATSGTTVYLENNYTYEGSGYSEGINITTSNITIDGKGHTIDAKGQARIFKVIASYITIKNITFVNGKIYNTNAGALWFESNDGVVSDCIFINNTIVTDIYNRNIHGGAIYLIKSKNSLVSNCIFVNNVAEGPLAHGGAISSTDSYGAIVSDCVFVNNTATQYGGGIDWIAGYGLISCCVFENNSAGMGGAILAESWNGVTVDSCIYKTNADTSHNIINNPPVLTVDNFTSIYNSGDRWTFNLTSNRGTHINDGNITIEIYKDNNLFDTRHCLSGEGWVVDLPLGLYDAVYKTEYADFIPVNATITITDGTTFWDLNNTINNNSDDVITLDKNYTYNSATDSAFQIGIRINRQVTIMGNGYTINANGNASIFFVKSDNVVLKDITFRNADGSAVYFNGLGSVINCNFVNNSAYAGGAVYFNGLGSVINCNFVNNSATYGGAVYVVVRGAKVVNCNFVNNRARGHGGAIYFNKESVVESCNFINNTATGMGNAIFFLNSSSTVVRDSIFINNGKNTIFVMHGENISSSNSWFGNNATNYNIKPEVGNVTMDNWLFLNATANPSTVPIFTSSDIEFKMFAYSENLQNVSDYDNARLLSVNLTIMSINGDVDRNIVRLVDSLKYTANSAGTGSVTAKIENVGYTIGLNIKANSTLKINKDVIFDYKGAGSTTVDFTNASGVKAEVTNQPKAVVTVKGNTITVSGLGVGTYNLRVTTITDENHNPVTKNATITVTKLNTALTASAKTFKFEDKSKKYAVTLKDSKGNAIKNARVTLKVNGVTYTATTNSNGVATFTLNKLTKTGNAVITYPGDKNHNKATKKIKLTVKAPAFKTVSYGSKDKTMVKKIQKALKKNGFYIQEKGRYLKIDGIFHKYTVKAVKQFQKANKLKVTGKVDYKTAKKLKIVK